MLGLLYYIVLIHLFGTEADHITENPDVRLNYEYNTNPREPFTVFKDKPLKIIIEKGRAQYAWCANGISQSSPSIPAQTFVAETKFNNEETTVLYVPNVIVEMSTRWACTVLQEYHGPVRYPYRGQNYTAKALFFNLHVRGAESVNLIVNNMNLSTALTNLTVDYDGESQYTYEDGEDINFSCERPKYFGALRLEYYDTTDLLLFKTIDLKEHIHKFRSTLNSKNNNYYIDCIYVAQNAAREYRYRTTFILNNQDLNADAEENSIKLSVEGVEILPIERKMVKGSHYIDYKPYRYIQGEIINIYCQKIDKNAKGSLNFLFDYDYGDYLKNLTVLQNKSKNLIMISINSSKLSLHKKTVACIINNTDIQKIYARIQLLATISENDIGILGLPQKNILYEYTNAVIQWTIEYQYSLKETLNLTCVSKESPSDFYVDRFLWRYQGNTTQSQGIFMPSTAFMSAIKFIKILDETDNNNKIQCVHKISKKMVKIILHLKPELAAEEQFIEIDSVDDKNKRDGSVLIPAVSAAVVFTVVTIICLIYWCRMTKQVNLIETYDSLSNQNDSPIPAFPTQWENNNDDSHYTKIDEGVMQENYTYSGYIDKFHNRHSNTPSENHYTEIDEYLKPNGLDICWDNAQNTTDKVKDKGTTNNLTQYADSKQGNYDELRRSNLFIKNDKENNIRKFANNKNVRFNEEKDLVRSNDSKDYVNVNAGPKQGEISKLNQDLYTKPGIALNKPKKNVYENNFVPILNDNTEYPVPYCKVGVNLKNDLYGNI